MQPVDILCRTMSAASWEILRIVEELGANKPKVILLENVPKGARVEMDTNHYYENSIGGLLV